MRPDSVTDNGKRGLGALYAVLAGYFLILGLQIVAKYFPQHQGVLSGIPYSDYLIGLITPVGTALFVVFVEITFAGYRNSSWHLLFVEREDKSVGYDLFFSFMEIFQVKYWFLLYATLGLYAVAGNYSGEIANSLIAMGSQFGTGFKLADIVLFVIVWSFFTYWNHRFQHLRPFWILHRLHHTATVLTLFTSQRSNPVLLLVDAFFRIWPFIFLLPDPKYFLAFGVCNHIYQMLVHSRWRSDWGWFGEWVLISPAAHLIHHSDDPGHYNKNLSILVIWDKMFGTWVKPEGQALTLGVREAGHNGGNIVRDIYYDVFLFLKETVSMLTFRKPARVPDRP